MTDLEPVTNPESIFLSKHLSNVSASPYIRFVVDDFIDSSTYEALRRSFPTELLSQQLNNGYTTLLTLSGDSTESRQFLDSNPHWDAYRESFESDEFVNDAIGTFSDNLCLRYSPFYRPFVRRRLRKASSYDVAVLLTLSRRGFFLTPHNDGKLKVISLIHYFPSEASAASTTGGTGFFVPVNSSDAQNVIRHFSVWRRGIRSIVPRFLIPVFESSIERINKPTEKVSEQSESLFSQGFKRDLYSEYLPNRLVGFVKTATSFHEVDLREFPADDFRCAAVINIRLHESIFSRISTLISKFETKLAKLKNSFR